MSRRIREAIEEFVKCAAPIQGAASTTLQEDEFDEALHRLEFALAGDPLEATGVERLLATVDLATHITGYLDARSPIADARLDLGMPMNEEDAAEVLAEPRTRLDRQRADAAFLRDSGLLFEINRRVLHPLGVAIAIATDYDGNSLRVAPELLRVDDPGGIVFADADLEGGLDKLRAFMKSDGYPRLARRYETRGFRGQVPEDVDPRADEADWTPASRELAADARAIVDAARDLLVHFERPKYIVTIENGRMSEDAIDKLNDAISEMREVSDDVVDDRVNDLCRELSVDEVRVIARRVSVEPGIDDLREAIKRYDGPTPDPAEVAEIEAAISTGFYGTDDVDEMLDTSDLGKVRPVHRVVSVVVDALQTEYNVYARRIDGEIVVRWVGLDGEYGDPFTLLYQRVRKIHEEEERPDDLETLREAVESGSGPSPTVLDLEVEDDGDRLRLVRIVGEVTDE